ncbi:MAG: hypothetical protein WCF67_01120 [Chitinophagaceae bacterium]
MTRLFLPETQSNISVSNSKKQFPHELIFLTFIFVSTLAALVFLAFVDKLDNAVLRYLSQILFIVLGAIFSRLNIKSGWISKIVMVLILLLFSL